MRRVLTDAFRMHGHEVVIARNGQEALRNFAVGAGLDVLVIDIGLPDSDGRDVCQALRAEGQHAPVLFLTALDAVHDRVSGFHAGGDDYVPKPFAISEVLVRVAALHKRTRPGARDGDQRAAARPGPALGAATVSRGEADADGVPAARRRSPPSRARSCGAARRSPQPGRTGRWSARTPSTRFIRRLRVKLQAMDSPVALETVRGVGFVLR